MMKLPKGFLVLLLFFTAFSIFAADEVTGLWMGIDDETGNPKTITMLYMYQGKLYGRILVTYDDEQAPGTVKDTYMIPGERADLLVGDPPYAGLDYIWGLEDRGRKWGRGKIMDPKKGKIYTSEIWIENGNLILRGKIGPIGRNQTWVPVSSRDLPAGFIVPDVTDFTPQIPQLK